MNKYTNTILGNFKTSRESKNPSVVMQNYRAKTPEKVPIKGPFQHAYLVKGP